jgi:hypothetical protein
MIAARRSARLGVAAALLGAVVALSLPSAPAQAKATHVAIVVGGVGSACVSWHSGMSGADVLGAAGFDVTYGQQPPYIGFLLTINGRGTTHPDDTHYWAYFHNTGGGWVYSSSGAVSYEVHAGTVEGWQYDNGSDSPPRPPSASYAAVCARRDAVPVTRAPKPTAKSTTAARAPSSTPTSTSAVGRSSRVPTQTAARSSPSLATSTTPAPPPTGSSAPPSSAAVVPIAPVAAAHDEGSSGIPPWGTALAIALVAALGGAAIWRARTQRQKSP